MKHFLTAATIAVLAFVVFEITQSDAQRRCPARDKPLLVNSTSVRCDIFQGIIFPIICYNRCLDCYGREQVRSSCLVKRRCTCIARPSNSTTTQAPSTEAPTTPVTTTTSSGPITSGAPSSAQPQTPTGSGQITSAVPSSEQPRPTEPEPVITSSEGPSPVTEEPIPA